MKKDTATNLRGALSRLEDYRRGQGRMHSIDTDMMIVIMGTMSGCYGFQPLGDFVRRERKALVKYLCPKNEKLPSVPTIWRVVTSIQEDSFLKVFQEWIAGFHTVLKEELVAIDGKALHGTKEENGDKKLAHLVSMFAITKKETLAMAKTIAKSNEIPLVQQMIGLMESEGLIYTMDAMHCQKQTLQKVIDNHCDYIVGVKDNQKKIVRTNRV